MTVMAGMVQSSWYSNSMPQINLPDDSFYLPVVDNVNAGMTGEDNKKNGMNVDDFGKRVADRVLAGKEKDGKIWEGASSGLVYWVSAWFPGWVLVSFVFLLE